MKVSARYLPLIFAFALSSTLSACPKKVQYPPVEFEARTKALLGDTVIEAEPCKLDLEGSPMKHDWFSKAIRAIEVLSDGAVMVLDHESKLRRYRPQGFGECELALDTGFGEQGVMVLPTKDGDPSYDHLSVDENDNLYVSGFIENKPYRVRPNGKLEEACTVFPFSGAYRIYPDGSRAAVANRLLTFAEDGCDEVQEFDAKHAIPWQGGFIKIKDVKDTNVIDLEAQGQSKVRLGKAEGEEMICSVGAVIPCAQGICVLDANCRKLRVWKTDGSFVGSVNLKKMLGLNYPWPVDLKHGSDVSYLAVSHDAKEADPDLGKKLDYAVIYRVKGLK